MYKLDINFLKDRALNESSKKTLKKKKAEPIETKIPLFAGIAALIALPLLTLGYLLLEKQQVAQIEAEISQADAEIQQLQSQSAIIQERQTQIQDIRARREALVTVFNQIKPLSVLLQDLSDLTPPGVQIDSIQQSENINPGTIPITKLTINGIARSYNDVNDFLLILQRSEFLNGQATFIESAQTIDNPITIEYPEGEDENNITIELPRVVKYVIQTEVNQVPASELMQQLSKKGGTGLVTRITTLKERGAIAP